ncbi:MAG: outer membrane beta-barrel protein [Acidobacteriota bacterium]
MTAGVPLTSPILDARDSNRFGASRVDSAARRYTFGPSLEFRIAGPLSLETGFLYKRFGFDTAAALGGFGGPRTDYTSTTTGNSWEFPFLAKSRLRLTPRTHITLTAGPVLRRISGVHETGARTITTTFPPHTTTTTEHLDTTSPASFDRRTSIGGAVGAGVEFSAGALRLTPGVRLTFWDTERTASTPSASRLNRTQFDALLNISYAPHDDAPPALAFRPGSFEFGVLGGVPLLETYEVEYHVDFYPRYIDAPTRRFAIGAYTTWHINQRFALEGSFLARRFGHTDTTAYPGSAFTESLNGTLWEVPLLFKVRLLRDRAVTPVLGFGPAIRRASNVDWKSGSNGIYFPIPGSTISRTAAGLTATAGLEWARGHLRVRPELRFSVYERPLYDLATIRAQDHSLHFTLGIGYARAK